MYFCLVAHTAPAKGWTRTFTNEPKYQDWLENNYLAATIFGLFAQSKSLTKAIKEAHPSATQRIHKDRSDADIVKLDLTHELNRMFGKFSFPSLPRYF